MIEKQKLLANDATALESDAGRRQRDELERALQTARAAQHALNATLGVVSHERDQLQRLLQAQDDDIADLKEKRVSAQADLAACDSERAAAVRRCIIMCACVCVVVVVFF